MIILNKQDALEHIESLNLNHFNAKVFNVKDLEEIKNFVEKENANEYVMRNVEMAKGNFFFVHNYQEILDKIDNYENYFMLCVSANPFAENIVLLGDIKIDKTTNIVDFCARTDKLATHRNVHIEPAYNLHTTVDNEKLWEIPGIVKLMDYITKYDLYDVIVEFAVYSKPVGNKKENVVIFELRNLY